MTRRAYQDYYPPDGEWKYEPEPDCGNGYEPEYSGSANMSWMDNYQLPAYVLYSSRHAPRPCAGCCRRPEKDHLTIIPGRSAALATPVSPSSPKTTLIKRQKEKAQPKPLLQFPFRAMLARATTAPMPLARPGLPRPLDPDSCTDLDIRASVTYGLQCLENAAHLMDEECQRFAVEPCEIDRYVQRLNRSWRNYKKKYRQRAERCIPLRPGRCHK